MHYSNDTITSTRRVHISRHFRKPEKFEIEMVIRKDCENDVAESYGSIGKLTLRFLLWPQVEALEQT